jgi:hypothetical protein
MKPAQSAEAPASPGIGRLLSTTSYGSAYFGSALLTPKESMKQFVRTIDAELPEGTPLSDSQLSKDMPPSDSEPDNAENLG